MAERTKRPEPKFAMKDKVRHITGLEGYVVEVHTLMQVQVPPSATNPNPGVQLRNLEIPIYVITYLDKNGNIQRVKESEEMLEKV